MKSKVKRQKSKLNMEQDNKWRITKWLERQAGRSLSFFDKVLLWVLLVILIFFTYLSVDANKYRALVRVIEGDGKVGVNPTDEALDFGDLSRGTAAVRRVALENGTPVPMRVIIFKIGDIRTLMKVDQNYFRLAPHQSIKIDFTTYMPASAEIDKVYDGRVYIFKVPFL